MEFRLETKSSPFLIYGCIMSFFGSLYVSSAPEGFLWPEFIDRIYHLFISKFDGLFWAPLGLYTRYSDIGSYILLENAIDQSHVLISLGMASGLMLCGTLDHLYRISGRRLSFLVLVAIISIGSTAYGVADGFRSGIRVMSYKIGGGLAVEFQKSAARISQQLSAGNITAAQRELEEYRIMVRSVTNELERTPRPLVLELSLLESQLRVTREKAIK